MSKKKTKSTSPQHNARQAKIDAARKNTGGGVNKIVVGAVIAVIAIVAVVAGVVISENNRRAEVDASKAVPAAASGLGKGFFANKDVKLVAGAPTLDVYEDFQCPACGKFEEQFGGTVAELAKSGKVKLVYHMKTIIDQSMQTKHSLKAANAAFCADEAGKFSEFHKAVFANQPAQEGNGWSDDELAGFASQAGISGGALDTWKTCVKDGKYNTYVESTEAQSSKDGVSGTPTVRLNGKDVELTTAPALMQAVEAATKK